MIANNKLAAKGIFIARMGRAPEVMELKFADQLPSILQGMPEKIDSDFRWLALDAIGIDITK